MQGHRGMAQACGHTVPGRHTVTAVQVTMMHVAALREARVAAGSALVLLTAGLTCMTHKAHMQQTHTQTAQAGRSVSEGSLA